MRRMSVEHVHAGDAGACLDPGAFVAALKAAAEPTRLRILTLLASGELNVTDFTRILGQSQPRISRHLKLLVDAGLVERHQEGSWAYFRLSEASAHGSLVRGLIDVVDLGASQFARDRERRTALVQERVAGAQAFFETYADAWDRIRALHVEEQRVEAAMRRAIGERRVGLLVDLGTGTGRILEMFAEKYERGLGIDINKSMLTYARSKLEEGGIGHAQVRYGDLYNLFLDDGVGDIVVMHQVLHYLAEPSLAVQEAVRVVADGGRLVIVDFAPHAFEFLREDYAHLRLGFAAAEIEEWLGAAGMGNVRHEQLDMGVARNGERKSLSVSLWVGERVH